MKKIIGAVLLLTALSAGAVVPMMDDSNDDYPDILNQSLITVFSGKRANQCQAVRITPTWYVTAAHCVYPACERECNIEIELLKGDLQAIAQIQHNRTHHPRVFPKPQYDPASPKNVRHDVALIHFIPQAEDWMFFLKSSNTLLDEAEFQKLLKSRKHVKARAQWKALYKANPIVLITDNMHTRQMVQHIAVPDLRGDRQELRENYGEPYYYFKELWHFFGPNFGVERGMSGGGVVVPGGTLVGIVSANLNRVGKLVTYNEQDEPVREILYSSDYFMITPFNNDIQSFISTTFEKNKDDYSIRIKPRFATINDKYAVPVDYTVEEFFGLGEKRAVETYSENESAQ